MIVRVGSAVREETRSEPAVGLDYARVPGEALLLRSDCWEGALEPVRLPRKWDVKPHWRKRRQDEVIFRCAEFEVLLEGSVIVKPNDQDQESCFYSGVVNCRNILEGASAQEVTWCARE